MQVQQAERESSAGSARGAHDESDESWERLENVPSHHSEAGEVEKLKSKRRNKHRFLHRHHRKHQAQDQPDEGQDNDADPTGKAARAKQAERAQAAGGGYANKDGILPLGQLKRNPSIASELPRDFEDVVVLTPKQQANLEYQQRKFHASHTFYRYRETVTHRPFELNLMIAIVVLLAGSWNKQAARADAQTAPPASDPAQVARFGARDVTRLLGDAGIIRVI